MITKPIQINNQVHRRFVLGRQGLWPGRRWAGKPGTAQAIRQAEMIQLDPLNVVARSHDLALLGRVDGYRVELLEELLYDEHAFFDFGESLFLHPIEELPYWRVLMQRFGQSSRWMHFNSQNPALVEAVREEIRTRGPLGNRDFKGQERVPSYRASKDTGLVLYSLWLSGELMTHHRQGIERKLDFRHNIIPPELDVIASEQEAEQFLICKQIAFMGMCRPTAFGGLLERKVSPAEQANWLQQLLESDRIAPVNIEGQKDTHYLLAQDLPCLEELAAGRVPAAWQPLSTTTLDEVTFLAPLEIVSARGRAKKLFNFDYVWEVYKPAGLRRWGYYTVPILYGDQLVARADLKYDRPTKTLQINGFWLEDEKSSTDEAFAQALGRGLQRLGQFLGAAAIDTSRVASDLLRARIVYP